MRLSCFLGNAKVSSVYPVVTDWCIRCWCFNQYHTSDVEYDPALDRETVFYAVLKKIVLLYPGQHFGGRKLARAWKNAKTIQGLNKNLRVTLKNNNRILTCHDLVILGPEWPEEPSTGMFIK